MTKKPFVRLAILLMITAVSLLVVGCSRPASTTLLPTYKVGYGFSSHEAAFMVAAAQGKNISDKVYLEEVAERQKYKLIVDGKPMAYFEVITTTGGNQAMQLMSQGHLDMALGSSAALMASVDKGGTMKAISPIHVDGIAIVSQADFPASDWDSFVAYVKQSKQPVTVGYHSPTSAPIILFEAAVQQAGLTVTEDPNNRAADFLLVNVKDTKNLVPAMNSKEVQVWVGPSPHPEVAVATGAGKIILDMKDMPPKGQWDEFPCCVASASEAMLKEQQQVLKAFVDLMTYASDYAMENPDILAQDMAAWCGVPLEAAQMNTVKFTTEASDNWFRGEGIIYEALRTTDKLTEVLKDMQFEEAKGLLFDFSHLGGK